MATRLLLRLRTTSRKSARIECGIGIENSPTSGWRRHLVYRQEPVAALSRQRPPRSPAAIVARIALPKRSRGDRDLLRVGQAPIVGS